MSDKQAYKDLRNKIKTLLILSHGQCIVERGFSDHCLLVPLDNEGLSVLRTVHDGIKHALETINEGNKKMGIEKEVNDVSEIPNTMARLEACRGPRTRYQNCFEDQTKQTKKAEKDKNCKLNCQW